MNESAAAAKRTAYAALAGPRRGNGSFHGNFLKAQRTSAIQIEMSATDFEKGRKKTARRVKISMKNQETFPKRALRMSRRIFMRTAYTLDRPIV